MSPNTDSRAVGTEEAGPDAVTVEKARTVFGCLSKLVLGRKIYAKNNPTLIRFADEFDTALRDFFDLEDELVVSIDKREIRWEDQVVYDNEKRDESIAFLLFKDGVGELNIQSTVTSEEMARFVDLIKNEVRSLSRDEDAVTKLWKADFEHISYRVLDEYLVGEFGEGSCDEGESDLASFETDDHPDMPSFQDKGRVIAGQQSGPIPIDGYLKALAGRGAGRLSEDEKEEHFQNMLASIFNVSADELRRTQDQVFEEKKTDSLVCLITEFLDFTLIVDNPSAVRDVMNIVECLADFIISELRGPSLTATLKAVRNFSSESPLPDNVRAFFERLERKLTNPSVLLSLGEAAGNSEEEIDDAFVYFELAGAKAVPSICKLLEEHADPKLHKTARRTLIRIAGGSLTEIIGQLNIDKPQIARDVIKLVKAADPKDIPHVIKELRYYPDDHVRYEVIQFLAGFGNDEAASLLVTLLDDADKKIRINTLFSIANIEAQIVRDKIEEMAFSKELDQREVDEQAEIFRALGRVSGTDVVPRLQRMIGKRTLFGFRKRHNRAGKLLAIEALEQIDGSEASKLLEDLAKDSGDSISKKAQEILLAHEGRRKGSEERCESSE